MYNSGVGSDHFTNSRPPSTAFVTVQFVLSGWPMGQETGGLKRQQEETGEGKTEGQGQRSEAWPLRGHHQELRPEVKGRKEDDATDPGYFAKAAVDDAHASAELRPEQGERGPRLSDEGGDAEAARNLVTKSAA